LVLLNDTTKDNSQLNKALENIPDGSKLIKKLAKLNALACFDKYLPNADQQTFETFLKELSLLDFDHFERHRKELKNSQVKDAPTSNYEPLKADENQYDKADNDYSLGLESLGKGEWGVVIFAGGSGTRFFSEWADVPKAIDSPSERWLESPPDRNDPKGMFPISPVIGLSFFERILAETLETGVSCGKLPLSLFMTSSVTHAHTSKFIEENEFWGLPKETVRIFQQGEVPRIDEDGDLIIKPNGSLFWTGNGHGGVYDALDRSDKSSKSARKWAEKQGVKHVLMGNVDNAALKPFDPTRIGYHVRKNSQFTITVVKRIDPTEKVGMTARRKDTGKVAVIEYSVLDPKLSAMSDGKGGLLFDGAHINTNLLDLSALRADLPGTLYTNKPIKVGQTKIASSTMEMLNQDLPYLLEPSAVNAYETKREEYFLPTKSVLGRDSVQSTFKALVEDSNRRLQRLGANVESVESEMHSVYSELHPALGLTDEDYKKHSIGQGWKLEKGCKLYICARMDESGEAVQFKSLHLKKNSSLIIKNQFPYGKLSMDASTRNISVSNETAGRINFGENVSLNEGIKVKISVEGNGIVTIPDGTCFTKDLYVVVKDGENITLS